jgi:CMP-N-acetylneuraminic acid synthetase
VAVVLQPTSPFRADADVAAAVRGLGQTGSCVSVVVAPEHPLKALVERDGAFAAVLDPAHLESPRQRLPRAAYPNGAVYVARYRDIVAAGTLLASPIRVVEMPAERSHDIDTPQDLAAARARAADVDSGPANPDR